MLLEVNQQIEVERQVLLDNPGHIVSGRMHDLRLLKMRLETAIALAEKQSAPIISECAPPGVTIH